MTFNTGETSNVRALTDADLQAVTGGSYGLGGLALQRAVEMYVEQQRIEALYADRM